jgi:FMN phosphatase YigB (HAD superfamily)
VIFLTENEEATNTFTCVNCGYQWKPNKRSYYYPTHCPSCKLFWDRMRIREKKRDITKVKPINISIELKQRLLRRKKYTYESLTDVVVRVLENDVLSMSIFYDKKQFREDARVCITVTPESLAKLKDLKKRYKISSYNEVIWRLLSDGRRKPSGKNKI